MNYLQAENVSKSYGDIVLFQYISLSLHKNDRVAIIAKNGAGKTTLLNIISGNDTTDTGQVIFRNGISIGYLKQDPVFNESLTVIDAVFQFPGEILTVIREYEKAVVDGDMTRVQQASDKMESLNAWTYESKIKSILTELKITDFNALISQLSGGQKKRVALANLLISNPDVLLMDEPTNHLDLEMIEWLEDYLSNTELTLLMVTHDRYFLDNVCTQILELENKKLYQYKGNYSYFLEKREERVLNFNAEIDRARNLMRKELDWIRRMPKARGTKAKYRVDAFYDLEEKANQKIYDRQVKLNVKTTRLGSKILDLYSLYKNFGEIKILEDFTHIFKPFEKAGIIGNNGTGKTTFLNIITSLEKFDSGSMELGETVVFGYYRQEGIRIDEGKRVIDVAKEIAEIVVLGDGSKMSVSQFLNYFLFPPERQFTPVAKLSGGERRRLYLMTVLMKNPNFLILDEPTNDLDIYTLNVLEDFLSGFQGCLLIVSHDRFFMDKLVEHMFVFEGNGKVKDFPGNYYKYSLKNKTENKLVRKFQPEKNRQFENLFAEKKKIRKLSFNEKTELESLEKDIYALENEKSDIETIMNTGTVHGLELVEKSKRLNSIIDELDVKTLRWLELEDIAGN